MHKSDRLNVTVINGTMTKLPVEETQDSWHNKKPAEQNVSNTLHELCFKRILCLY